MAARFQENKGKTHQKPTARKAETGAVQNIGINAWNLIDVISTKLWYAHRSLSFRRGSIWEHGLNDDRHNYNICTSDYCETVEIMRIILPRGMQTLDSIKSPKRVYVFEP